MKSFLYRRAAPLLPLLILAYALSWSFHLVLFVTQPAWLRALWTAGILTLLALWFRSWKTFLAGLGLLAAAALWGFTRGGLRESAERFFGQTFAYLTGGPKVTRGYIPALIAASTALACLAVTLLSRIRSGFPALFLFTAGVLTAEWLFGHEQILPVILPAAVALLMLLARSYQWKTGRLYGKAMPQHAMALWTLPMALLVTASSFLALTGQPAQGWKREPFARRVELINDYLADYTGFSSPRGTFSLASTGFSPHSDRLGGPITPDDTEVLWVAADRTLLLRGNTYNSYESDRWTDTTENSRYRLNALTNQQILADVFDLNRPDAPALADAVADMMLDTDLTVVHLCYGSSSMFTPFRVDSVTPTQHFEFIVYFNDKGDVFSTRDMETGSGYTIHALLPDYENPDFPALMALLLSQVSPEDDDKNQAVRSLYLDLPEGISPEVYALTESLTQGAANDYEKMVRIARYLSGLTYTLTPAEPPEGDFVSGFLQSGEGYCTYFASAMAVMARIAGMPSRYVEGYRVVPGRAGRCTVTNESAHAWTEIYFGGIGWIPFDPTPQSGDPQSEPDPATDPNSTAGPAVVLPQATPKPAASPSAAASPRPSGVSGNPRRTLPAAALGAVAIALLLLLGLAALTRLRTSLWVIRARRPAPGDQAAFLFGDILALLALLGAPMETGETLYAYAARAGRWLSAQPRNRGFDFRGLSQVADNAVRMTYSNRPPDSGAVLAAARFRYALARHTLRALGPLRYYRVRVLLAPGNWRLP